MRRRSTTPDPPARTRVLALVREQPGATVSELARHAGFTHTTATYHLHVLSRRGAVVSLRNGNRLHWFANGQLSRRERALVVCRRHGRTAEVLARVPADAPAQLRDIAAGLAMTPTGVSWHLARLRKLGLVHAEASARGRRYRAAVTT